MAVVHKSEIARRLNLPVEHQESLVITPLLQEAEVMGDDSDADAVDLRLGTYFLLPQVPPQPFFFPSRSFAKSTHFRVHVPLGSYLVVPAHQTVLGSTLEFLKLPNDLSGQILTKSSIARTFMVIETAPWIHPCYRGSLTLEIANVSNTPLLLYPGRFIGQLILLEIRKDEKRTKQKLSGSYLGPVYPEPPVFNDPEEDLAQIGVPRSEFRRPGAAWMNAGRENETAPTQSKEPSNAPTPARTSRPPS
jgi:dCTP deaminase